ncbi:dipeptidyl aminopeptidase/acylaminoacyl peptidase [Sphingomonas zeicaulis]|uniref:alpha/beta hydrolase family protein n=1 Tax=Sphingomonas zeicaulis TaxID=1632740 RepID=UPI003D1D7F36
MARRLVVVTSGAFALCVGSTADAQSADQAAVFGARESVEQVALSPDGTRVVFVQPMAGQASAVLVSDLAAPGGKTSKGILHAPGKPERINWCRWASNTRLLCGVYGITTVADGGFGYFTRMVALDADGSKLKLVRQRTGSGTALGYTLFGGSVVDWNPGSDGHVLMAQDYVPESDTGTRLAQTQDGLGVDDINTVTLTRTQVERARPDAFAYVSDGKGNIRLMGTRGTTTGGYSRADEVWYFRKPGSRTWERLGAVDGGEFEPAAVDGASNVAYGTVRKNGLLAAYKVALDGSGTATLLFKHDAVDVDDFIRIGRNRRVIGVSFATDRREARYFDPELEKLAKSLSKALPKLPLVRFVDSSQDETKLLLWAGSDTDPGRYYLFDRTARSLNELLLVRPALENAALSEMVPVTYPAADGTMIPGYLSLPPGGARKGLPAIVMPHGGPGARDEWGFDWLAQFLANQGYAVLQPNFRGSAGYGDQWFKDNGFKSWRTAIGDVNDGARWLEKQGIAAPGKLAVFGWSYGGYAALQSAATEPGLFKAVVAVAPVTDLQKLKEDRRNWVDFLIVSEFVGSGPHIEEGSPVRQAARIAAPVMLVHGTLDRNVSVGHARAMEARLKAAGKPVTYIEYEGLDHYLDDSVARTELLRKSAAFIGAALGVEKR